MTEAQALAQRRALVVLAAELQRATVVRRLERLRANPVRRALGFALRLWRGRSARRPTHH